MTTDFYYGLSEVASEYDYFLIDLWGVLHDGKEPYPHAIETLKILREKGKKVILLSNAPRRVSYVVNVLETMGFTPDLYDHVMTSGEATHFYLEITKNFGKKYFYIGPEKDHALIDDLDFIKVTNISEANFALVTGFEDGHYVLDEKLLKDCLKYKVPFICTNPDRTVVRKNGEKMLCAGFIAEAYINMGGIVHYFGKPYNDVYQMCFELLETMDVSKIMAIGDNLYTDIEGANTLSIYSVFVAGGILAEELGVTGENLPDYKLFQKVCEREGTYPSAIIPSLRW